jgi:hypothetical protein
MQKDSLILALFILAAIICLGATLIPNVINSFSDSSKKIKAVRIEQAVRV